MSDVKYRIFIKDWKTENEKNISGFVIIKSIGPKKQATGEMSGFRNDRKIGRFQTDPSFSRTDENFVEELIIIFYSKIIEEFQVDLTGRLSYELEKESTLQTLVNQTPINITSVSDSKSSELKNIIFNVQKEGIFSNAKFGDLKLIGESGIDENIGFDFGDEDDLSDLLLEDEFRESEFDGLSESEISLQEEVSNNQEDFNTGNSDTLPDKVSISLSKNLDDLLKDSSKAARILGKSSRVKYENLRIGYKKGIHGLCPQGTVSVLVAMIGIKELGLIGGNADWYSFKNPATGGKPWPDGSGFDKSINNKTYYNSKVRIEQINSSWKGTYIQNSNMWQVGDIIACGYKGGKKYGHIQIWTGYSWMSDFKQNTIQQRNVDTNTVSLWRLNQNGVDLLKNKNIS